MVGTASSGPRARDTQQRNARNARGSRSDTGHDHPNYGQYGDHCVGGEPVANAGFTWKRAEQIQCVKGVRYTMSAEGGEREYFTQLLDDVIAAADKAPPQSSLLRAAAQALADHPSPEDVLEIATIEYAQLKPVAQPDLSDRNEDADYVPEDCYEMYTAPGASGAKDIVMVQAPVSEGGRHYEVLNQRSWPWSVVIVARLKIDFLQDKNGEATDPGEIDHAVCVQMSKVGKEHRYASTNDQTIGIKISVGEINASTANFVPWKLSDGPPVQKCIMIVDPELLPKLFYQCNKKGAHWPKPRAPVPDTQTLGARISQRWMLESRGGSMCYYHVDHKDSENTQWVPTCNFELVNVEAIFQFIEADCGDPYAKVICRQVLDPRGEGTIRLRSEDSNRSPNTHGAMDLEVEVLVQLGKLRSNADVKDLFYKHYPTLVVTTMTPDMIACWMAEQSLPEVTKCIVRFGRQPDGAFVSGNLVFDRGALHSLEAKLVEIVPAYFNNSILPVPTTVSRPGALGERGHPAEL